ncbi:MAG: DUF2147 domain-containing protein [Cytophagales bacterium]|nr:DUF2147 domain-containing protein [Cytophagales bacterium]
MEANMMMIAFVLVMAVAGALIVFFLRDQFLGADFQHNLVGVWYSEQLQVRILIYDMDSIFQGSVVWAESMHNSILGTRVLENLRVGMFKKCRGSYIDPHTAKEYDALVQLKSKTTLKIVVYEKGTQTQVFVQEWKLVKS